MKHPGELVNDLIELHIRQHERRRVLRESEKIDQEIQHKTKELCTALDNRYVLLPGRTPATRDLLVDQEDDALNRW